jgi:hypothetical protein
LRKIFKKAERELRRFIIDKVEWFTIKICGSFSKHAHLSVHRRDGMHIIFRSASQITCMKL